MANVENIHHENVNVENRINSELLQEGFNAAVCDDDTFR